VIELPLIEVRAEVTQKAVCLVDAENRKEAIRKAIKVFGPEWESAKFTVSRERDEGHDKC